MAMVMVISIFFTVKLKIINTPGLARVVLQTASAFIDELIKTLMICKNIFKQLHSVWQTSFKEMAKNAKKETWSKWKTTVLRKFDLCSFLS